MAADKLGLITRGVADGTSALTGQLVVWNAMEEQVGVVSACGTAPSADRKRRLRSDPGSSAVCSSESARSANRTRVRGAVTFCTTIAERGQQSPDASMGKARRQAGISAGTRLATADALQSGNGSVGGMAVGAGGVAAGAGRGVAGASIPMAVRRPR
jgi:hypothetical protein